MNKIFNDLGARSPAAENVKPLLNCIIYALELWLWCQTGRCNHFFFILFHFIYLFFVRVDSSYTALQTGESNLKLYV